jgi:murein tripeptide amidase MpaA
LKVLEIGTGNEANRPSVWIDGGIHAREWISPASVAYMAHQLVENYGDHRDIVDRFTIYINVVMNPDG